MKTLNIYLTLFLTAFLFMSCSDSSPVNTGGEGNSSGPFVIAARPNALDGVADYLLTTGSLTEGTVSLLDNGIEQDGTYRYYVTNNKNTKFYSLLYGQGNPGAVTAYQLTRSGELEELVDFQSETVQAFAPVNDDILMMKIPRNSTDSTAHWYRLSTKTSQFINDGQVNVYEVANNGEMAFFSWLTQVGDKVYGAFFTVDGQGNAAFSTSHPNHAWVAVFSYPEMELQTVIEDDRTSFIGRYFVEGLSVVENGDIYAFSSSLAMNDSHEMISTKPSAITRIKSGTTEFDQSYFFNLAQASGGYYVTNHVYASDGNFLLVMRDIQKKSPWAEGQRFAIVNVFNKSFEWVTGVPDTSAITSVPFNYHVSEDGNTVYTGITTKQGSYVYAIDVQTAQATQGLEVVGGTITAISKLKSTK